MTAGEWIGLATLILTVLGILLAGVRWIVKNAVKDNALTSAFIDHKQADEVSFAALNLRLDTGAIEMRDIRDQGIKTAANVETLLRLQTNPPPRPPRATD